MDVNRLSFGIMSLLAPLVLLWHISGCDIPKDEDVIGLDAQSSIQDIYEPDSVEDEAYLAWMAHSCQYSQAAVAGWNVGFLGTRGCHGYYPWDWKLLQSSPPSGYSSDKALTSYFFHLELAAPSNSPTEWSEGLILALSKQFNLPAPRILNETSVLSDDFWQRTVYLLFQLPGLSMLSRIEFHISQQGQSNLAYMSGYWFPSDEVTSTYCTLENIRANIDCGASCKQHGDCLGTCQEAGFNGASCYMDACLCQ